MAGKLRWDRLKKNQHTRRDRAVDDRNRTVWSGRTVRVHPWLWLTADELGSRYPSYLPTYDFGADFIDETHRWYSHCPLNGAILDIGIRGWLRKDDALKLYEMAFFSSGDTLEIGSYEGLSTSIMGKATANTGLDSRIVSLELDPGAVERAKENLRGTFPLHEFMVGDARESCRTLKQAHRTFGFAFVDHSHTFELVRHACEDLKSLVKLNGFALFHDFNDPRNGRGPDYGVYQAVCDAFADGSFEFCGVYGCTGLYRHIR